MEHTSLIKQILLDHSTETTKTPWYSWNIAHFTLNNVLSLIISNVVNSCPLIALLNHIFYYIIKHAHKTTYACSYNCVQKYMARYINGCGCHKNCVIMEDQEGIQIRTQWDTGIKWNQRAVLQTAKQYLPFFSYCFYCFAYNRDCICYA